MKATTPSRFMLAAAALALAVLAVLAVLDRLSDDARAAARQALLMRAATLAQSALTPGSLLPCVDGTAGGDVGEACTQMIFANPQSAAAAVAYMGARIDLLNQASALARRGDDRVLPALASTRRAIERDPYGIAAHVLAQRDGCTAAQCALFAALDHADTLKANLKARTFQQFVARYAAHWPSAHPRGPAVAKAESPAAGGTDAMRPQTPAAPAPAPVTGSLPAPAMTQLTPMPRPRLGPSDTGAQPDQAPADAAQRTAAAPASPPATATARAEVPPLFPGPAHKPVPSRWDFPSADSIPAVSIMNPEPKLPKPEAEALARDTAAKTAQEHRQEGKEAHAAEHKKPEHKKTEHEKPQHKKEAGKNAQEPGAPLQLTR